MQNLTSDRPADGASSVKKRSSGSRPSLALGVVALGALIGLGAIPQAKAQTPAPVTLTLTPSVATVTPGAKNVQFTLTLTGGTDIFSYSTYISLNNSYLTFTSANPFVSSVPAFNFEAANDVLNGNTLSLSYTDQRAGSTVNNTDPNTGLPLTTALGYFTANVSPTAPVGLTAISLSAISMASGGSSVINQTSKTNELTAIAPATVVVAPEPSQDAALGLGMLGLGGLALTARRRLAANRV